MRRIILLVFIALVTVVVILMVKRPDLVSHFWLWLVGLAGPIIAFFKRIIHEIENNKFFKKADKKEEPKPNV
jgi:hypothetical protein